MRRAPVLRPLPPRRFGARLRRWFQTGGFGGRELLLIGAALGLLLGVSWVDERYTCTALASEDAPAELERRDAALDAYLDARCSDTDCARVELVSTRGCLAKIRVEGTRVDEYGDNLGLFREVEGLSYSPVLGRWRHRETLESKQLLGVPVPR